MRSSHAVHLPTLKARGAELSSAHAQTERINRVPLASEFDERLEAHGVSPLHATGIDTLQINVGKLCNQVCKHCHVDAGPDRTEVMTRETMQLCLDVLAKSAIQTVDITGGAPELNPNFRWFVTQARALGRHVIDRCNLTIIETGAHRDLPQFFAQNGVELVCSLPHYRALSTDRQRGDGVFERSISALKRLNAVGYAQPGSGLRLVLVTNPVGAFLPAAQASLETEWKREMQRLYDVQFDGLFCITNMPISRYLEWLDETDNLDSYMQTLLNAFNPGAVSGVMCRQMISVAWDGQLFDCDFNQMLELGLGASMPQHIRDFDFAKLQTRSIATGRHCFGCTAGAGSSCGGVTT